MNTDCGTCAYAAIRWGVLAASLVAPIVWSLDVAARSVSGNREQALGHLGARSPLLGRAPRETPTRLAILLAEDRRAPDARDLAVIRAGLGSADEETERIAVRALGRLERPALIADVLPALTVAAPEVRAEAATAIAQAAQGWKRLPPARTSAVRTAAPPRNAVGAVTIGSTVGTLVARLGVETDPGVRAAISEALGRLPYTTEDEVKSAEAALVQTARGETVTDRLGIARGAEALVRLNRKLVAPSVDLVTKLRTYVASDPIRDARVRRLALETLITADAADESVVSRAAGDPDAQIRRLAMRAAATRTNVSAPAAVLRKGLTDPAPMVRLEALRGLRMRQDDGACAASISAVYDLEPHVALAALDDLGNCHAGSEVGPGSDSGQSGVGLGPDPNDESNAVALLQQTADDLPVAASARNWHRAAHALVALAKVSAERAQPALPRFAGSTIWQLRMYAARAAAVMHDRSSLEKLAADSDDNVREAALEGLNMTAGHAADATYREALARPGYQVIRIAAMALADTPSPNAAIPALEAALQRLNEEGRDNSRDARVAIVNTLETLGIHDKPPATAAELKPRAELSAVDFRRLSTARARVTMRDLGVFELALIAAEAPASVARFVHLAESGYYNGLTFHRVVPNFVIQGGSPGANEYVGDASFMRDEVGSWPHVRGAVGISTRGRDTGDAQFFIDLVDNPRLDHEYTVFAQLLAGMDVVDAIMEGDVIERVDILPGAWF